MIYSRSNKKYFSIIITYKMVHFFSRCSLIIRGVIFIDALVQCQTLYSFLSSSWHFKWWLGVCGFVVVIVVISNRISQLCNWLTLHSVWILLNGFEWNGMQSIIWLSIIISVNCDQIQEKLLSMTTENEWYALFVLVHFIRLIYKNVCKFIYSFIHSEDRR